MRASGLLLIGALLGAVVSMAAAEEEKPLPRVRNIVLEPQELFASGERLDQVPLLPDLTWIFDAANILHVDTRPEVIRRELLVREGDPADPHRIEESERNLRASPYVREVHIWTEPVAEGWVDLIVQTQDTWTTEPRLSFGRGGGKSTYQFGVVEKNVLGYGKRVAAIYRQTIDRSSSLFQYEDPRVLGSRLRARGTYQETSDGRVSEGLVDYPFFALDTPWAGGGRYTDREERNRIFAHDGSELSRFTRKQRSSEARIGHLVFGGSDAGIIDRAGVFYRRIEDDFPSQATGLDPSRVPLERTESQPGVFLHREELRFVRERHFNLFDRVEDFNLGNVFDGEMGYSTRALGATRDEPIATLQDRQGFDMGLGHKAFLFGLVSGRLQNGVLRNAVVELEAISYHRVHVFFDNTLVLRGKIDLARRLDVDTQLFLGNENGLRGFSTRQFVGTRRLVLNAENRMFFVNDLFHLVSLGAALFADAGYVWDRGQGIDLRDLAASAGIGLRIDAPRSAGEALFRLDLAVPLTAEGGKRYAPAVSFGAGHAFTAFSGPFDLQTSAGD